MVALGNTVTDVLYDGLKRVRYHPVNHIVRPEDWAVTALTGEDCDGEPCHTSRSARSA